MAGWPFKRLTEGGIMHVFATVIAGVGNIVDVLLNIYKWVIIIAALISWVNPDPYNPIVQFLHKATEPALRPLRKLLPPWKLGLDFSPLIAVLIIHFILQPVMRVLFYEIVNMLT
jgi:YggT family protein